MNSHTSTTGIQLKKRKAISETAYETLKNDIIHQRIKSGAPLIEEDLAARFQISRTPIREMLRRLENDKLVTYYPYRGHFVNHFGRKDILEVYQIRVALECICCRDIVEGGIITDEHIAQMEESVISSRQALAEGDIQRASQIGDFLHNSIVQLMGNERIQGMLAKMNAQCMYFNTISTQLEGRVEKSIDEHSAVVQALKVRNAKLAEELLRAHILNTQQDVLTAMGNYILQSVR